MPVQKKSGNLLKAPHISRLYIYIYIYGGNTLQNSGCMATYHPSGKLTKLDEPDMWDTAGEVRITHKWYTLVDPFTWMSKGCMNS